MHAQLVEKTHKMVKYVHRPVVNPNFWNSTRYSALVPLTPKSWVRIPQPRVAEAACGHHARNDQLELHCVKQAHWKHCTVPCQWLDLCRQHVARLD